MKLTGDLLLYGDETFLDENFQLEYAGVLVHDFYYGFGLSGAFLVLFWDLDLLLQLGDYFGEQDEGVLYGFEVLAAGTVGYVRVQALQQGFYAGQLLLWGH